MAGMGRTAVVVGAVGLGITLTLWRNAANQSRRHVCADADDRGKPWTTLTTTSVNRSLQALAGTIIFTYSDCLERDKRFWGVDIGLTVLADKGAVVFFALPGTGGSLAVVQSGISAATTPPISAGKANFDTVMVCLLSEDVDGWTQRLAARGHPVVQQPQENRSFGIRNALLRSPAGYLVEIQCFTDPALHQRFIVSHT